MNCRNCKSDRIIQVIAKCKDLCYIKFKEKEKGGYVPYDLGIGGEDYIKFSYCADCGMIQDEFPIDQKYLNWLENKDED
jgi:hypothetical protein